MAESSNDIVMVFVNPIEGGMEECEERHREKMQRHKNYILSGVEWGNLINTLEEESEPNEALIRAAKDYKDAGMK